VHIQEENTIEGL